MLMEEIGGLDKLEVLQNHDNEEIYENSFRLINFYFMENVSIFYLLVWEMLDQSSI
jgi:hypothetical protein